MGKPRILIVTDTPVIDSGMGVAHREIGKRLYDTGKYEIASFGWFFHSAQQRGVKWDLPWRQYTTNDFDRPYGHPQGWPDAKEEDYARSSFHQVVEQAKPDIVLAIGDMWMCDYIYKYPLRNTFKLIHEVPLDGEPIPKSWVQDLKLADIPVVMSEYGKRVIQDVDPYVNVEVLPRGIDIHEFHPLNVPKRQLRQKLMHGSEDKFVVGIFDRFQDRKQIQRGMEAFSKFIHDGQHDNCDLYLHLDMNDPFSMQAHKTLVGDNGIVERYGLENHIVFNSNVTVEKGVPVKELVALYNCCDVKISASQGEGWGLTNIEAMACGVPVIGTNYTTFPELLGEGRGLLANVKTYVTGMYNVERALVDTEHMAQLIEMCYRSPDFREKISLNALKYVKRFSWEKNILQWEKLIDKAMSGTPYRLLDKPAPFYVNSRDVNIEGAINENTGWAITTRGFFDGLTAQGWNAHITESGGRVPDYPLDKKYKVAMESGKPLNIDLINHMPEHALKVAVDSRAQFKAVYFPFELNHMNEEIVNGLNRLADIFLCPTTFVENIAKKCGVRNTAVVPLASDIQTENVPVTTFEKGYKFLMLGNLGDIRKNTLMVVKAFLATFTEEDDVSLVLKSMPGHEGSDPSEVCEFELLGHMHPAMIQVVHNDDKDVATYYKSCDCLIQASFTEGWGHPVFEALKFGMPVIATNYGGHLDFAKDVENVQLVDGTMEFAFKSPGFKAKERWCVPKFDRLCGAMRKAKMLDMRKTDENHVSEYSWAKTGEALVSAFDKIDKKPKRLVCYERQFKNLWNEDNEVGFKTYAPNGVQFVSDANKAGLQILDITRISDKEYLRCDKYVLFMHCFGEWSEENPIIYRELFSKAQMVYSHLDLEKIYPEIKEKFMRGPWGVSTDKWMKNPDMKNTEFQVFNTGEIAETEGIKECVVACDDMGAKMIHVGPNLGYRNTSYRNASNLDTAQMRELYNRSKWVSALRRFEGFEKPAMEGLLCGCRPICFDTPLYRHWYGKLARYVKEATETETSNDILRVFREEYEPVTPEEMEEAINKFSWKNVSIKFWNELERRGIM